MSTKTTLTLAHKARLLADALWTLLNLDVEVSNLYFSEYGARINLRWKDYCTVRANVPHGPEDREHVYSPTGNFVWCSIVSVGVEYGGADLGAGLQGPAELGVI